MNAKKRITAILLIVALWINFITGIVYELKLFPELINKPAHYVGVFTYLIAFIWVSMIIWKYFKNRKSSHTYD